MFDPPHNAHVTLVTSALEGLGLDHVAVVVTGVPSHRPAPKASGGARLAMTRAAFADVAGVSVSDLELAARPGQSPPATAYTVETLEALAREHGLGRAELVLLVGADQAAAFTRWHRWRDILDIARLAVAARPKTTDEPRLALAIDELQRAGGQVERFAMAPSEVSSTTIRRLVRDGRIDEAEQLVPAAVRPMLARNYGA